MPDDYKSGWTGYVALDGTHYSFGKWSLKMRTKAVSINNFTSEGFDGNVSGFTGADITCDGPYNRGNMPIESGTEYEFHLGYDEGAEQVVNARVTELTPNNDAEDTPRVAISAVSNGLFDANIT